MIERNQLVTAAMTLAFAMMMLMSAWAFVEQRAASDGARSIGVASLPL